MEKLEHSFTALREIQLFTPRSRYYEQSYSAFELSFVGPEDFSQIPLYTISGRCRSASLAHGQPDSRWTLTLDLYDKEKLQERLAKLAGGVAVLYVGAA